MFFVLVVYFYAGLCLCNYGGDRNETKVTDVFDFSELFKIRAGVLRFLCTLP